MNNSTNFSGNSVFGQLISLIPKHQVQRAVIKYQSDKFTKRFSTWEHLVSMLFATASNTTSLRDVTNGLLGLEGKLQHLSLKRPPKRSTISDANKRRSYQVFEKIYYDLLTQYQPILSDSRFKKSLARSCPSSIVLLFFFSKTSLNALGVNHRVENVKAALKCICKLGPIIIHQYW